MKKMSITLWLSFAFVTLCGQKIEERRSNVFFTYYPSILEKDGYTILQSHRELENVVLSDGSKVSLNCESTIIYPSLFSTENKRIKTVGEVFLEVAGSFPIQIEAEGLGVVKCSAGSKVNIKAYQSDDYAKINAVSGTVIVYANDSIFNLKEGEVLTYEYHTWKIKKAPVIHDDIFWLQGRPRFDAPLRVIINSLLRQYDCNIKISPEAQKEHFTFTYLAKSGNIYRIRSNLAFVGSSSVTYREISTNNFQITRHLPGEKTGRILRR